MKIVISKEELMESHHEQRIQDALDTIADACTHLETLAQIQAAVGGLSMSHLSGKTFECAAKLGNFHDQLVYGNHHQ